MAQQGEKLSIGNFDSEQALDRPLEPLQVTQAPVRRLVLQEGFSSVWPQVPTLVRFGDGRRNVGMILHIGSI
jgi:hypothetical protein